jgi:hypothetical protein
MNEWMSMELWWMIRKRENSTQRKPFPMSLCPPQILHGIVWDWTMSLWGWRPVTNHLNQGLAAGKWQRVQYIALNYLEMWLTVASTALELWLVVREWRHLLIVCLESDEKIFISYRFLTSLMRTQFSASCVTRVCSRRFEFDKLGTTLDSHMMSLSSCIGFCYQKDSLGMYYVCWALSVFLYVKVAPVHAIKAYGRVEVHHVSLTFTVCRGEW